MFEIAGFLVAIYTVFTLVLIAVWLWMPDVAGGGVTRLPESEMCISVVVPVRNEEGNIIRLLKSLENQTLPKVNFEVIVVNDHSTDQTATLVDKYRLTSSLNLILCEPEVSENNTSPKKRAIKTAIKKAGGQYIITTDGDCEVEAEWLETYLKAFFETNAVFLCGPVTFFSSSANNTLSKLWNHLQTIEFSSLIGSAACSMALKAPNMCSGANMAYKKEVFYKVKGFEGNEELASGDDEFLMHKIAAEYPDKVFYIKNKKTIVQTNDQPDWQSFYKQRKRWASKWKHYSSIKPTLLAVFIFLSNLSTIILAFSAYFPIVMLRFVAEFIFLGLILNFLKKRGSLVFIPLTQLIYPFYVIFFGLIVQGPGQYTWKGRQLK